MDSAQAYGTENKLPPQAAFRAWSPDQSIPIHYHWNYWLRFQVRYEGERDAKWLLDLDN